MHSKKELEILLEKCEPFKNPKVWFEQYVTPSPLAADLLNLANLKGDISDKHVVDLGCGTGRLAIGASLLNAKHVNGYDIDSEAIVIAEKNAQKLNANVEWMCSDVDLVDISCDTIIQNPPFGVKRKGADRLFIKVALRLGKVIYTMHKTTTRDFIKEYIKKMGGTITELAAIDFVLPHSYSYHKKRLKRIEVDIYRIERRM